VVNVLLKDKRNTIEGLEKKLNKKIHVKANDGFYLEHFETITMQ